MRKVFATYLHSLAGGLIATFILAYPQAQAVAAPDRGVVASAVTLGLFLGVIFAGLLAVSVVITRLGIWGSAKTFRIQNRTSRRWLSLIWGCAAIAAALFLTPFGDYPLDIAGVLAAWVVIAGFGAMAAEEKFFSRANMTIMGSGTLISIGAGFAALSLIA
ncbi:MAG: hypothetical protein EA385_15345 [Salinarimonadaceae bacterium]|nr:MAG: hypothetical protein EA385_15345 [Salinarimonadaceae bacterium]